MTNNHLNTISGQDQQYCLRWNNHQTNLTNVFVQLFQSEEFTDTTLFCEGGPPVKCHKMVLAACSSYFQSVFAEVPGKHSAVVLKDVGHAEMKAILDYMYKGEVNIAHDQLAALLKVAEMLKVKGLVQDNTYQPQTGAGQPAAAAAVVDEDRNNIISTSSPNHVSPDGNTSASKEQLAVNINNNNNNNNEHNDSPPHSTGISHQSSFYAKNYYGKSPPLTERPGRSNVPMWPMPALQMSSTPVTKAMFGGSYDAMVAGHPGMSPLRRKKLSSMLMGRDTPILRTVLGQGQADSSQQLAPIMYGSEAMEYHNTENNSNQFSKIKIEGSEPHSPFPPDMSVNDDEEITRMGKMNNSSSPQSMYSDSKSVVTPGIATYVPSHKPEWKRYKQYTRQDIMSAIDAVRTGMSALQASRKFGVPSRTLYDKVKKLGITTSRPFRRSGVNNGSLGFAYGLGPGTSNVMFSGQMSGAEDESGHSSAMEHAATAGFLHHALGLSGVSLKSDHETSNNGHSPHSDRMDDGGSPCSPELIKYAGHREDTRSPTPTDNDDQAQDLSVSRKSESSMQSTPTSRVIMAPISQTPSVPMLAAGNDDRD